MTQPLDTLDWTNAGTCLYQGHNLSTEPTLVRVLLKDTTCQHNQFNQRRYLSCSRTQPVDTVDIITAGTCLTQGRNLSTEPTLVRVLLMDTTCRLNQRWYVSYSRTQPVDWTNAGTCLAQGHNMSTEPTQVRVLLKDTYLWTEPTLVRVLFKDTTCRLNQRWYVSCSRTQHVDWTNAGTCLPQGHVPVDWTNAGTCLIQGHNLSTEPTLVRVLLKDTTCQHNQFNQRWYVSCSRTQHVDWTNAGTCLRQGHVPVDWTNAGTCLPQGHVPVDWTNAGTCLPQGHVPVDWTNAGSCLPRGHNVIEISPERQGFHSSISTIYIGSIFQLVQCFQFVYTKFFYSWTHRHFIHPYKFHAPLEISLCNLHPMRFILSSRIFILQCY